MDLKRTVESIVLGIRNHASEAGFEKVVIGVSGGMDSALVATLAQMALGAENVHFLLMPYEYSSPASRDQGEFLARNLGCACTTIPISLLLHAYKLSLASFGSITETLTEENLQARIRGNLLMAYANHNNTLVFATGNKSERMMGYCTLYGDTIGSIAPIGELYKTEVYEVANYINREKEIIPKGIIERAPSAELSPGQKDTDSLPPYNVLDAILASYEDNLTANIPEVVTDIKTINSVLDRIKKNKFKAAQSAPVIKWRK